MVYFPIESAHKGVLKKIDFESESKTEVGQAAST